MKRFWLGLGVLVVLLAFGCGKEFLPEGLDEYIRRNGLYNTRKNWKNLPMEELEKELKRVRYKYRCTAVLSNSTQ